MRLFTLPSTFSLPASSASARRGVGTVLHVAQHRLINVLKLFRVTAGWTLLQVCRPFGHSPATSRFVNKDRRSSPGGAGAANCDLLMSGCSLRWGKNVQKTSEHE